MISSTHLYFQKCIDHFSKYNTTFNINKQSFLQSHITTNQWNIMIWILLSSAFAAININTASGDELTKFNGVGPATAAKIIDYREIMVLLKVANNSMPSRESVQLHLQKYFLTVPSVKKQIQKIKATRKIRRKRVLQQHHQHNQVVQVSTSIHSI